MFQVWRGTGSVGREWWGVWLPELGHSRGLSHQPSGWIGVARQRLWSCPGGGTEGLWEGVGQEVMRLECLRPWEGGPEAVSFSLGVARWPPARPER